MSKGIVLVALLLCLSLPINIANAATFMVGDSGGWTFGVGGWPNGTSFKAGDVLVFKYATSLHNVIAVSKANFDSCTSSAKTFSSGNDQITLTKGANYFICGRPGHCPAGLKMVVTAN